MQGLLNRGPQPCNFIKNFINLLRIFKSTYFEKDLQTTVSNSSAIFTDSIISYSSSTPTHITTSNSFSLVSRSTTSYKSNLLLIAQLLTVLLCFLTVNHQNSTEKLTIWQTFAEPSEHRTFVASVQNICNLISWEIIILVVLELEAVVHRCSS